MHSYVYSETLGDGDGERERERDILYYVYFMFIFQMETGTINNLFIGQWGIRPDDLGRQDDDE